MAAEAAISDQYPARRVLIPAHLGPVTPVRHWPDAKIVTLGGETMGTTWSAKLVTRGQFSAEMLRQRIADVLARVIAQMSTWVEGSDIDRFNRAPAGSRHILPPEFARVVDCALALSAQTNGAYDPTIGALVDVWGFGPRRRRSTAPGEQEIAEAHSQCGWQRLNYDREAQRIVQPGGLHLDLSSIAKGFAVDLVADTIERLGIGNYLIEIGGELRGCGMKPDAMPWWVALENPGISDAPARGADTIVALHGLSIATSGDTQRSFQCNGRTFSHSIDPRTGYPVPDRLMSVTVFHRNCMSADALATALTILGPDEGLDFASGRGIAARFLSRTANGSEERVTPAFQAMLD